MLALVDMIPLRLINPDVGADWRDDGDAYPP